jgi:hypothetical protein
MNLTRDSLASMDAGLTRVALPAAAAWPYVALSALIVQGQLIWDGVVPDHRSSVTLYWSFLSAVLASAAALSAGLHRRQPLLAIAGCGGLLIWSFLGFVTLGLGPDS